jgi:hypothetical protein
VIGLQGCSFSRSSSEFGLSLCLGETEHNVAAVLRDETSAQRSAMNRLLTTLYRFE